MGIWNDFWENRSLSNVIPNLKKTAKTVSTEAGHLKDAFVEESSDMYKYGPFGNLLMDIAEEQHGISKDINVLYESGAEALDDIGDQVQEAYDEAGGGLLGAASSVKELALDNTMDTMIETIADINLNIDPNRERAESSREEAVEKIITDITEAGSLGGSIVEALDVPLSGYRQLASVIKDPETAHKLGTADPNKQAEIITAAEQDKISQMNYADHVKWLEEENRRRQWEDYRTKRQDWLDDMLEEDEAEQEAFQYDYLGD